MNIFTSLKQYAGKWEVKSSRAFSQEEIDAVVQAVVVDSTYGLSVQFTMRNGGLTFIPLEQTSSLGTGELVDLSTAELVTLGKSGELDIHRVRTK